MLDYTIQIPSYTVGPDAYLQIPKYCSPFGRTAVVIGGHKAMAAARDKLLSATEGSSVSISDFIWYGEDATREASEVLQHHPSVLAADMLFAVGGGKAVDTVKITALALGKPFFTFPTIASNCAAASSLAIIYYPDGTFREFVHYLDTSKHVFIDTDIIAHAPWKYLWAGIGDTYAKYYEVSVSASGEQLPHYIASGVTLSRMCMEPLVRFGEQAIADNKAGLVSEALTECALTIIITTGWVSMLVAREHTMDYNGGIAHALFYSLCELPGFDETHIHGVVVGFGVLLQLLICGDREEFEKLRAFNLRIGLPVRFSDIDITLEDVRKIAERMTRDEDLEHFPFRLTVEQIMEAAAELA